MLRPPDFRFVLVTLSALLAAGCATIAGPFTRADELEAMAREPVPPIPATAPMRDVASWDLTGTLPDRIAHVPLKSVVGPFGQLLAQAAGLGHLIPTEDLTCVAQQVGRFELENDGAPSTLLESFIESRCGSPSAHVQVSSLFGDAPDARTDDELAAHWGSDISKGLGGVPPGAFVGLALLRAHGKARITFAWALDEVQLEPVSIFPDGDVVRVKGTVAHAVDDISGSINQGAFEAVDCVRNPAVTLPAFELACPTRNSDAAAWLGIWVRDPGRFLSHSVLESVVWPARAPTMTFVRPTQAITRDGSAAAFLETLNALRTKLGRAPLTLAGAQSDLVGKVASPYWAAARTRDTVRVDRIALGLIAGWRIEAPVTEGTFSSNVVPEASENQVLALMVERPGGRHQLLSKDARVLAFATHASPGTVESMVCTYSLIEEPDPASDRLRQLIDSLSAERKKRGLPAVQWMHLPTPTAAEVGTALRANKIDPTEGLERLMAETGQLTHKGVRGWRFSAASLTNVHWPEELLKRPALQMMLTVAPWKERGMPWTSYVFLVVALEGASSSQT